MCRQITKAGISFVLEASSLGGSKHLSACRQVRDLVSPQGTMDHEELQFNINHRRRTHQSTCRWTSACRLPAWICELFVNCQDEDGLINRQQQPHQQFSAVASGESATSTSAAASGGATVTAVSIMTLSSSSRKVSYITL